MRIRQALAMLIVICCSLCTAPLLQKTHVVDSTSSFLHHGFARHLELMVPLLLPTRVNTRDLFLHSNDLVGGDMMHFPHDPTWESYFHVRRFFFSGQPDVYTLEVL